MERKLEEIDEILVSYEDWMHGINGEQCTKARKLLAEVQQQLKILNMPVVSGSLPDTWKDDEGNIICKECGQKYGQ